MSALRQWFACKLGRHFFVEFCTDDDDEPFTFCLHCGTE